MKLGRQLPSIWRPNLDFSRYVAADEYDVFSVHAVSSFDGSSFADSITFTSSAVVFPKPARKVGQRWEHQSIHLLHDAAGNLTVGNCTCAGILKLDLSQEHNANGVNSWQPNMQDISLALYSAATGYDPSKTDAHGNNPTDNGAELSDILNYVQENGIDPAGHGKGIRWVEVDATKPAQIAKAIDTFGGVYTGAQISPDWLQSTNADGAIWDVASPGGADDGHCVAVFDYNEQGVIANSWGFFITITWEALGKYWSKSAGGEVYAVFSPDWLNRATEKSPSGFNAAQLATDLKALG